MSLYGALFSGVSGLQSQSSAMGAISDNVSNVNTVGYKGTTVNFQTLVTAQVSVTQYSPGGVQSAPRTNVDVQGLLQATTSSTDFGISGQGFFVVSDQAIDPSGYAYSRAGSFKVDKDGYLQNVSGYYLQGWPLIQGAGPASSAMVEFNNQTYTKAYKKADGETFYINDNAVDSVNMQPLNLNTIGGTARATGSLSIGANLPAGAAIGNTEKTNALIFDSLGNSHNLNYQWTKRGQNVWDMELLPPAGARDVSIKAQDDTSVYFSSGRIDFTDIPDDGTSFTIDISGTTYTFDFDSSTPTDSANVTLSATGDAGPFTIGTQGRTLSQVLDSLGDAVEQASRHAYDAEYTGGGDGTVQNITGKTPPGRWAERLAGTDAIIFRQGSESDEMSVDTSALFTGTDPSVIQTPVPDASGVLQPWTVAQLSAPAGAPPLPNESDWRGSWVNSNGVTSATDRDYPSGIVFNGDGTPARFFGYSPQGADDPATSVEIGWSNGAADMQGSSAISQFLGNYNTNDAMQQLSGDYQLNYVNQNGNRFGNFTGVTVSETGIVTALFDNGVQAPIFMVPIATFVNPNGMNALTGNVFQQTDNSGLPTVREAGTAGAGTVAQATLESSTVDLGQEFTTMITTQRAYSAAAKIITTSDDMLEELIRIKR
ncbi:flagellar hook protein FlgE [Roseospira goensis]|uniref:Flagellar hook protein FlgE n=1 Tax=Roseospira goensis TaxID=391922 RepID=A0A7W6S0Z7_9PROT|nr:flagellar hook-basal body complex protein [Roseospira goensis]MBB4286375.1 flagellar hook protein FlgE [Roseospira goensis]